jgi:hypothetical protein
MKKSILLSNVALCKENCPVKLIRIYRSNFADRAYKESSEFTRYPTGPFSKSSGNYLRFIETVVSSCSRACPRGRRSKLLFKSIYQPMRRCLYCFLSVHLKILTIVHDDILYLVSYVIGTAKGRTTDHPKVSRAPLCSRVYETDNKPGRFQSAAKGFAGCPDLAFSSCAQG